MGANLDLAHDIARRLHETWTDAWFHEDTHDLIVEAVRVLDSGQLRSTVGVANAILKANPFSDVIWPDDVSMICDDIDGLLNDYARFCERQLVLGPVVAKRPRKRKAKSLPTTPAQRRAIDAYAARIAHHTAMSTRAFPPNVIDLVQYRAQHAPQ